MSKGGRPTSYTPELLKIICDRLAEGEPLAEICRDKGMPHPSTVRSWGKKNEAVSLLIADAREDGEERITANIRRTAKGDAGFSTNDVQRDKLIIDTDLKLLAKWNPKKYGEKLAIGGDPDMSSIKTEITSQLSDDKLNARILALAAKARAGSAAGDAGRAEATEGEE